MARLRTVALTLIAASGLLCIDSIGGKQEESRRPNKEGSRVNNPKGAVSPEPDVKERQEGRRAIDFVDPTYGGRIRQLYDPSGDEHDLYHYRTVFNADHSRFLGIETPQGSKDYHVTLYDGEGNRLRRLFTQKQYSWKCAWDRNDPRYFYTSHLSNIYRYDIETNEVQLIKSVAPLRVMAPDVSLNQKGDRILVPTSDKIVRSYRLPRMDDERSCQIEIPDGFYANWDKLRFTGCQNYFALTFVQKGPYPLGRLTKEPFTRIYDAGSGGIAHTLNGIGVGHHDFSPNGKLAYVEGFPRRGLMKVHIVNIDGTNDRVVYEVPRAATRFIRSYHITWPDRVNDWFIISFFPQTGRLPGNYKAPLDELMQIHVDGTTKILARTGTTCGAIFWAQPQQSPSADGTRILFHTNGTCRVGKLGYESSGTIDQCILWLD